ncbi:MAG TPA: hypothetical protein VGA04_04725 [Streptosporangiaceae bacterium]
MSITAIVLAVLTAVAFPLLLWVIGRGVTAVASRAPAAAGRSRQYLAGRLYGVQVIAAVACADELLVSLTQTAGEIAGAFRVSASECSLARVERWRDEGTLLRGYLSEDGAIMLADPVLGGNAACEPAITLT